MSSYTDRNETARRFEINHLLQGLLILDSYNATREADEWTPVLESTAIDAIRRAVDISTAFYWHAELTTTPGTPRPTQEGWPAWFAIRRDALNAEWSGIRPAPVAAPTDPMLGAWIPPQRPDMEPLPSIDVQGWRCPTTTCNALVDVDMDTCAWCHAVRPSAG
ncbi:hypothetical protein ACFRCW_42355 [Streptomyces sp. NPDC056653]|uniref:hypothetical protein n=1 Tax=Streptomyces sp. NPDC056653 TaxID=3345894 RepID=UPI00368AF49F